MLSSQRFQLWVLEDDADGQAVLIASVVNLAIARDKRAEAAGSLLRREVARCRPLLSRCHFCLGKIYIIGSFCSDSDQ